MDPSYPIFDADNHIYEVTEDVLGYLPKKYRNAIQLITNRSGRKRIAVNGQITDFMPNPTFEKVAAPGAHVAYYSGTNTQGKTLREMSGEPIDSIPAFREPGPRLSLLDELGVDRALMFPTIANLIEYTAADDPRLTHAAVHAVNEWLYDTWTYEYEHRIFTTPVITLPILDEAIAELDLALERGARAVLIRPAPANGFEGSRSIALPEFDPIWARLEEANVPVCMHASFPPLTSYFEQWEPTTTDSAFAPSPLKNMLIQHREIEDALAAMVCHGALSRFPGLKVLSVENGADWVAHLLQQLDSTYRRMPQEFGENPVEVFKRQVYVNPFWEDDIGAIVDLMGEDHVLFGSDYPHPEGLARPLDYFDYIEKEQLDQSVVRKIMSGNGHSLLGLAS